ncbi:MAG: GAF domain-containing protein [Anaerolineales bacterium]|uniref:PDC sensor domain-containing protein n=1 Tax=Candidatus Villigracilis vicinus TaxID=3140679 RepID=UPI00313511EF|nr:GAF domain-containing protein [Anaerolineales bacterium]
MRKLRDTTKPVIRTNEPRNVDSRRFSLSLKLPSAVIGVLIIAFTIYTFLSIRLSQQALLDTLREELQDQAAAKVEVIRSDLFIAQAVAKQLAVFAETDSINDANLKQILETSVSRNERVFGSTISYEPNRFQPDLTYYAPYYYRLPDNTVGYADLGTPDYDYFNRDWYSLPKASLTPMISKPYFDYGGGEIWMVTWSAPFFENNGDFQGIATADIAFSHTQEIISTIDVGQNGYAFMIDSAGIILGIGENGGEYKIMSDSMVLAAYTEKTNRWIKLIADMRAGKSGFIEATDPRGEPMLVAYAPVGLDTGWSIALAYPRTELSTNTAQLRQTLIGYTVVVVLIFSILLFLFTRSITEPLRKLKDFANRVSDRTLAGNEQDFPEKVHIQTQDELEDLGNAFNQMSEDIKRSFGTLEDNVATRTKDLARLALQLRTVAEVNSELAVIRDQSTLLNVSASLIRERLGYYHVGIFLVDEKGEFAILRGASSTAADEMLARNYKLRVGETGMVGNVTSSGRAYIAQDVDIDSVHFNNPYLPETRSEITLPLRSYNVTIGALDIQAKTPQAFGDRDLQTLQVLADQLAAAIENSQLVERLETTLSELSKTNQEQTRQTWQSAINKRSIPAYEYDGLQIRPMPDNLSPELAAELESGKPIILNPAGSAKNTLLVPLTIFGQVIGVIGLEQDIRNRTWSKDQIAIAQAAANRAALTLENARLFEESNRRAIKESTIFEATNRIGSAVSMENILQITAEELEKVLSSTEITIQFTDGSSDKK